MNHHRPEEQIRELLERYGKGECTGQEIALLEKWYERVVDEKAVVRLLSKADEERLIAELRKAIKRREGMRAGYGVTGEPDKGKEEGVAFGESDPARRSWKAFRFAAVWTGLVLMTGGTGILVSKRLKRSSAQQQPVFIEIATGYEQIRKVLLPDNSVVWLNSATHLYYHPDFLTHRELRLSGEAFFEVVPDVQHPFVVRAGNASTQVFGTAFNISAYPEAGQWRISLKSGKVGVVYDSKAGKKDLLLIQPGQLFIYDKEVGAGQVEQQSPGEMDVWTAGRLMFYKTPLKEAIAQIEARYGVHIVYDHALKNQTITARFENTVLKKVLEHLSFGWDLHFYQDKGILHVR